MNGENIKEDSEIENGDKDLTDGMDIDTNMKDGMDIETNNLLELDNDDTEEMRSMVRKSLKK
jgi:hypothetical protein